MAAAASGQAERGRATDRHGDDIEHGQQRGAAFAGVPVTRTVVLVAMLSGALAGLAGAIEVAGRTSYVTLDMSPGYGYTGIVIAMLAGLHPLAVVAASVFVAGMLVGADSMSRAVSGRCPRYGAALRGGMNHTHHAPPSC